METQLDYSARVLAANAMSASVQYLTQRNYLGEIANNRNLTNALTTRYEDPKGEVQWIKITQIGRQMQSSMHQYFSTMQKILYSCHEPHSKQLLFLIYGNGKSVDLYLGVRLLDGDDCSEFATQLSSFIKSSWQGVNANSIEMTQEMPTDFLKDSELKKAYMFTGIPSFVKKEGEEGLTSIDTLLGTLSNQKFAYLVVADPIDESKIISIINECNEMAGQLESVKSFNFTESANQSTTETESISRGLTLAKSISDSTSKKSATGNALVAGMQLAAGMCFSPAVNALTGGVAAVAGMGLMLASSAASGFVPQHTHSESETTSQSISRGFSQGYTEGQSKSLATTIVNRHVEYIIKRLNAQLERFEEGLGGGMWNTGVYLLTSNDDVARSATLQLKSIISGKNSHLEPVRIHKVTNLFRRDNGDNKFRKSLVQYSMPIVPIAYTDANNKTSVLYNPFEGGESQLSTMLTTEELSCLVNFPQRSVPGISVIDSSPDFSLKPQEASSSDNVMSIGNLLYSFSETNLGITIPINTLTRHTLVTGVNGSGKTNTILNILNESAQRNIPFMVIEPAKTEYVDWAIEFNKQLTIDQANKKRLSEQPIKVFIPGKSTYKWHNKSGQIEEHATDSLRMNPFEVIGEGTSNILAHLDRIKATFGAAFPMYDILPVVMETLLFHIYKDCLNESDKTKVRYPQMLTMRACIEGVINSLGYDQRNRDNIKAAVQVRINSLLNGWKKDLFDNPHLMDISWNDLFNGRCVINLSAMGDDADRAFVMSLLLQFLYEYRIAESELEGFSFNANQLRHLVFVEEAHRVMSYNPNPDSPQAKCGQLFSNMLSEIRAYGQGMVIVDQVPNRLIPDAIKNTNLKIIHRLIASDDIDAVASSMGLTTDQRTIIPRLATGQAIVSGVNAGRTSYMSDADVYWCKIHCKK